MLSSDDFLLAGANAGEVAAYRTEVFPARKQVDENNPRARQRAQLEALETEHREMVAKLMEEITTLQDDHCKLCTLYRKLVSKAQSMERQAQQHDLELAEIGVHVAEAKAEMDALTAAYDGPLRAQLDADAARCEAAIGATETPRRSRTEGVFAAASQAVGSRDVCGAGIVTVTGSSSDDSDEANLGRIPDASWDGIWRAAEGGFLEFDFGARAVKLTGYAIRVAQVEQRSDLRAWVVQGLQAGNWTEIDRKEGDEQIAPGKAWVTFPCGRGKGKFARIRITQTGPTSAGEGVGFALTNVEFFGALRNGEGE
jgi:hypothetical protein